MRDEYGDKETYRYILSLNVTMVWFVLAGGILPGGGPPLSLFITSSSHRLLAICSWFKSKAARSFMKIPSTWPPKMKILDPSILRVCP